MDVFELEAKIKLDDDSYKRSLNKAGKDTESAGGKIGKVFSKLGKGSLSALKTSAKALGASLSVAAAGVTAISKKAIDAYSNYEQLVGGVEKLYGNHSKRILAYAKEGYKSVGLSMNQYMETATQFSSSLIKSLDGDQKKAADMTDKTMRIIADNVSVFGSNYEDVSNAIKGLSRENYVMLDNMKLGFSGTKEGMEELLRTAEKSEKAMGRAFEIGNFADMIDAIQIVQEEMGIAGNSADEAANTIEGSTKMMKAAWENLLVGITDDTQDFDALIDNFVSSVGSFSKNIMPRIETAIKGVGKLVTKLAPTIMNELPSMLDNVLPDLVNSALDLVTTMVTTISKNAPQLITTFINTFKNLFKQVADYVKNNKDELVSSVVNIIQSIVDGLMDALPELIESGVTIITAILTGIGDALPQIADMIPDVIIGIVNAIVENLPMIFESGTDIITSLIEGILGAVVNLVQAAPDIILAIIDGIVTALPLIIKSAGKIIVSLAKGLVKAIPEIVKALPEIIWAIIQGLGELLWEILELGGEVLKWLWDGIWGGISWLGEKIGWFCTQVYEWLKGIWDNALKIGGEILSKIWDGIKEAYDWMANTIKELWDKFTEWLGGILTAAFDMGKEILGKIWEGICQSFQWMADLFSGLWNTVWGWVTGAPQETYITGETAEFLIDGMEGAIDRAFKRVGIDTKQVAKDSGSKLINNIKDGVNSSKSSLSNATENAGTEAVNKLKSSLSSGNFSSVISGFTSIGYQAANGFGHGFDDAYYYAKAKIQKAMSLLTPTIRKLLDIRSPSKKTAYLGRMFAEGFSVGFTDRMTSVRKEIDDNFDFTAKMVMQGSFGGGTSFARDVSEILSFVKKIEKKAGDGDTYNLNAQSGADINDAFSEITRAIVIGGRI